MVDVPLPTRWRTSPRIRPVLLKRATGLILAFLLALGVSFALTEYMERRCDRPLGKLAVQLKLDAYYSNCKCMTHMLDFSDPCNSMYIPLLGL